jgi:hypothetical protein
MDYGLVPLVPSNPRPKKCASTDKFAVYFWKSVVVHPDPPPPPIGGNFTKNAELLHTTTGLLPIIEVPSICTGWSSPWIDLYCPFHSPLPIGGHHQLPCLSPTHPLVGIISFHGLIYPVPPIHLPPLIGGHHQLR